MAKIDSQSYSVVVEDQDIVIRFDKNMVNWEALTRFLDFLELEAIRKRSQLTPEQAAELASTVDRAVWVKLKANHIQSKQ